MTVAELVVAHIDWIKKTSRRFCDDSFDADDLAGETIFKCLNNAVKFDKTKSFKPWVLTIMANTFKTQYNRRKCVLFTSYDNPMFYPSAICSDQLVSVRLILSIIRNVGRRSCCVECVLLYAKGYSYEEIADIVGIPLGTVKSRVASGRKLLRHALD